MRAPPAPDIQWDESGALVSRSHGDVYFSRDGGLAESRAVFLAGCRLPEAWEGRAQYAIGELGFGTGLNALATWQAWRFSRPKGAVLHYVSIEAALLSAADAARAHSAFPEIADLSARLIPRWPVRADAPQRLWFEEDGFGLTVLIGEASAALDRMIGSFDAWFLDGFAPSRNGDMWKAPLLSAIARHSRPGARLATYSVAGLVRRGLEAAGFAVERKPGFAAKRERLEARLVATPQPVELYGGAVYGAAVGPVAIVGAGIAGASLAAALARRGREAFLIDAAGAAATGASGNPAGLVMPRLDRGDTAVSRLHRAAYLAALDVYRPMGEAIFRPCAVHQKRDAATLADFASDPPMPADHLGFTPSALVHRQAGVLDPAAAARRLAGSTRLIAGDVVAIERTEAGLVLRDASGRALIEAGAVVLAAGPALRRFAQTHWLPLQRTRGQIEWGPLSRGAPASAIADGAYAAPYGDGIVFGATFDRLADEAAAGAADAQSRSRNLSALAELDPDLAAGLRVDQLTSRVGIRAATADRLPIAGLAPDADLFVKSFADVRAGRPATGPGPGLSGLYLHGGLGSRGLTLAPLLAERLASEICNEPQAIDKFALQATGAERFLLRTLRKSKLRLG